MTYTTGDLIRAADYDRFVIGADAPPPSTTVASAGLVWGTGFSRYGFGQPTSFIHPVAVGDVVRAQEWDNLDAIMQATTEHQQGPNTYNGPGAAVAGTPIRPLTHFASYIQSAFNNTGTAFANIDRNINTTTYSGIWGHAGSRAIKFVQTFTFDNADSLRHFFNAGGKVKISFDHSGVGSTRNTFWDNLCTASGTIVIGHHTTTKVGGNGTLTPGLTATYGYGYGGGNGKYIVLGDGGGFWANTAGASKLHFKQYGTTGGYGGGYGGGHGGGYGGGYGGGDDISDYITVELRVTGGTGVSGGLGTVLEIATTFENGLVVTPASKDQVSGASSVSVVLSNPDTSHLQLQPWNSNIFNGVVSVV